MYSPSSSGRTPLRVRLYPSSLSLGSFLTMRAPALIRRVSFFQIRVPAPMLPTCSKQVSVARYYTGNPSFFVEKIELASSQYSFSGDLYHFFSENPSFFWTKKANFPHPLHPSRIIHRLQ